MRPRAFMIVLLVGAFVGLLFSAVSTYDFARHVDRQVHDLHCSFVPGLSGAEAGESGCQVTLLSPYSSVWRTWIWGGVPISLPAMSVFGFLLFFGVELLVTRRQGDPRATGFLALATGLPALASLVMAVISLVHLDALCKLCAGVYAGSALALVGGVGLWWTARTGGGQVAPARPRPAPPADADPAFAGGPRPATEPPDLQREAQPPARVSWTYLGGAFAVGVLFVSLPVLGYVLAVPDHGRFIGQCGALADTEAPGGVLVPLGPQRGNAPALEVLDPLCPACRAFEQRLSASGLSAKIDRKALLFPLDDACNWMVDEAVHPGACAISEAVLCAGERAGEVLAWSFDAQDRILEAAAADPEAARRLVVEAFPELGSCVGTPAARARLNKGLRWAVQQGLPVLTPQLYVAGVKLCDEDVDLGLDFSLRRMLDAHAAGTLRAVAGAQVEPEPEPPTRPETAAPAAPSELDPARAPADLDEPLAERARAPAAETGEEPAPAPTSGERSQKAGGEEVSAVAGDDGPAAADSPAPPAPPADDEPAEPDEPAAPPAAEKPAAPPAADPDTADEGGAL